jgi:hypothetical protein
VQLGAYIARERARDQRTGKTHDHRRKGGCESTGIVGWEGTSAELWNAAETKGDRKNSVTARHTILALPNELPPDRQDALMQEHAKWINERNGVAVAWARHKPDPAKGENEKNDHGHMLETTWRVDAAGVFGEKARELDSRTATTLPDGTKGRSEGSQEIEARRVHWAAICNRELAAAGITARIDHRSLERRAATGDGPVIAASDKARHQGPDLAAVQRGTEQRQATGKAPAFVAEHARRKAAQRAAQRRFHGAMKEAGDWLDDTSSKIEDDDAADIFGDITRAAKKGNRKAKAAMRPVKRQASDMWCLPPDASKEAKPKPDAPKIDITEPEGVRRGKPKMTAAEAARLAAMRSKQSQAQQSKKKGRSHC